MAWTAPVNTFASGNVLTAAQMNAIGDNLWAGGPVYATEALRDAAIPSAFEGQRAYITGPTVTAPTAATYATLPTGITTVYNGSVWVCTTPITALSTVSGTTTSGTNVTTLTGDTTAISVTCATGTTAALTLTSKASSALAGRNLTLAVTVASTPVGLSPAVESTGVNSVTMINGNFIVTGLTAGNNTFTLNYSTGGGTTATWTYRSLTVQGIA